VHDLEVLGRGHSPVDLGVVAAIEDRKALALYSKSRGEDENSAAEKEATQHYTAAYFELIAGR